MLEKQYLEKLIFNLLLGFFLEQGKQRLGVVWEEAKRLGKKELSFSRPFSFQFAAFDRQKSQQSSTNQLLAEEWRVPYFCAGTHSYLMPTIPGLEPEL